jgi:hypothetical protein
VHAHIGDQPLIMVMQAADFWHCDDSAVLRRLHWSWLRAVHRQRQMRAPAMIILEVLGQELPQMSLVQDNHVV